MIFKQIAEIENGTKTQTRRIANRDEYFVVLGGKEGHFVDAVANYQGRIKSVHLKTTRKKWAVGDVVAIVPKRGQKGVGFIRITSIRLERLDAISEADALAEGIKEGHHYHLVNEALDGYYYLSGVSDYRHVYAKGAYRALWESINGAGSWDENPMVWVIEFKYIGKEKK